MRYITTATGKDPAIRAALDAVGNISKTGSVIGMQQQFGWPKNGQVQCGDWIYNVGTDVLAEWRKQGLLKGEGPKGAKSILALDIETREPIDPSTAALHAVGATRHAVD